MKCLMTFTILLVIGLVVCISDENGGSNEELTSTSLPDLNAAAHFNQFEDDEDQESAEQKCLRNGGPTAYQNARIAHQNVLRCMRNRGNKSNFHSRLRDDKLTSKVYDEICKSDPIIEKCLIEYNTAVEPCLDERERHNQKIAFNMTMVTTKFRWCEESAASFDSIDRAKSICIRMSKNNHFKSMVDARFTFYMWPRMTEPEDCKKYSRVVACVLKRLKGQKYDTAIARLAESWFNAMKQVTPCGNKLGSMHQKDLMNE